MVRASGLIWRIEFSLGPLWSRAPIRVLYMFTREVAVRVPAANCASSCAIVTSSMLGFGGVWDIRVGLAVGDGGSGIFPSNPLAPEMTAATPALYLRKSLLETLPSVDS